MCQEVNISYNDIVNSCKEVENYLGISKKNLVGTSFSVNLYAHRFPSAYYGMPEATQFDARYTASGWRVTVISRCNCNHQRRLYLHLSDTAKSSLVEQAETGKWF